MSRLKRSPRLARLTLGFLRSGKATIMSADDFPANQLDNDDSNNTPGAEFVDLDTWTPGRTAPDTPRMSTSRGLSKRCPPTSGLRTPRWAVVDCLVIGEQWSRRIAQQRPA